MDFDITDRTDHNRIAEQFAARLREESAAPQPANDVAPIVTPAPKRATRLEAVAPVATAVLPELKIVPCEQNTAEWHQARMGIATSSSFDAILTAQKPKASEAMPDGSFPIKTEEDLTSAIAAHVTSKKKVTLKRHIIARARALEAVEMLPEGWDDSEPKAATAEQKVRQTYMLKLAGEILTGQPMEMVMTRDMERGHMLEPEARDLYTLQTGATLDRVGFIRRGRAGCSPDSLIGEDGGLEIKTKAPHLLIDVILKDEFPAEHMAQVQGTLWITGRQWWDLAVYWPGLPLFVKRIQRDEAYIANLATEVERFNSDLDAIVAQMKGRIEQETNGFEFAAAAA